jgi:general stress protein YciG
MSGPGRRFSMLNPEDRKAIARRGGKAAHAKGTAHEWTAEEAKEAGRKGGHASQVARAALKKGG